MQIEASHLSIILQILKKYPYSFHAFGSRVKGTAKKFSDFDLVFFDDIPWNLRSHIDEDFEESDLPFKVDVIDWQMCDAQFREAIKPDLVCIQEKPSGI